jgi:Bacterial Ig-like domain (group 2)
MFAPKSKLRLICACAVLATLALAASCRGFFVNPTLTAIAVSPNAPQVELGTTLSPALQAYGTYSDGSTGIVTSGVSWTSETPSVATITAGGILAGVSLGTATINVSAQAVTGSATATVYLGGVTAITVSPSSASVSNTDPSTIAQYVFTATANGSPVVITTATGGVLTISPSTAGTDLACTPDADGIHEDCSTDGNVPDATYSVTMTYPGSTASASANLTVTGTPTGEAVRR